MNWDAIGAIGEIIGALAVLITLIYLSIQIRQNTRVARSTVRQAISESSQTAASDVINNADVAKLFYGDINGEKVEGLDWFRLQARCWRDMHHYENVYFQATEGLFSSSEWAGYRRNIAALMVMPSYQEYWQHESSLYSDSFQAEMSSILLELEKDPSIRPVMDRYKQTTDDR